MYGINTSVLPSCKEVQETTYQLGEACQKKATLLGMTALSLLTLVPECQLASALTGRCMALGQQISLLQNLSSNEMVFYASKGCAIAFSIMGCLFAAPELTLCAICINLVLQTIDLRSLLEKDIENPSSLFSLGGKSSSLCATLASLGSLFLQSPELLISSYALTSLSVLIWVGQEVESRMETKWSMESIIEAGCYVTQLLVLLQLTLSVCKDPQRSMHYFIIRNPQSTSCNVSDQEGNSWTVPPGKTETIATTSSDSSRCMNRYTTYATSPTFLLGQKIHRERIFTLSFFVSGKRSHLDKTGLRFPIAWK